MDRIYMGGSQPKSRSEARALVAAFLKERFRVERLATRMAKRDRDGLSKCNRRNDSLGIHSESLHSPERNA